jgi:hypothetical protein
VALHAGDYFRGEDRNGSLGMPLSQLRTEDLEIREIADASLVGALALDLQPASAPADRASCFVVNSGTAASAAFFELPRGGVLLGAREKAVPVGVSRYTRGETGVPVGQVPAGHWAALRIPPDSEPAPWLALVSAPVYACPLP